MTAPSQSIEGGARRCLYLSYDGMTDPLGRSQVLPYLVGLAAKGHCIRLVSLEKPSAFATDRERVEAICVEAGIDWHPSVFRSGFLPIAVPRNIDALARTGAGLLRTEPADLLHCRSDLPALAGLRLRRRFGVPMLYDMRAFWPDERAEGGAWDQRRALYRAVFRFFKRRQAELLRTADRIVALSEAGAEEVGRMFPGETLAPITVIPCCADFDHFRLVDAGQRSRRRGELGLSEEAPLLVHLGTLGSNTMLPEMLAFLGHYRATEPDAKLLLLDPAGGGAALDAARAKGLQDAIFVRSPAREEVPSWLGAADLGLFFVRPGWAKKAASPTKLAELLACGLPVVANAGVGDVARIVADCQAGVVVDDFTAPSLRQAVDAIRALPVDPSAIRSRARRWFDLGLGVARYDAIYRGLPGR